MAQCDPLSMSSRNYVLQPSQYTYLHKTTRDMLAFNYFTMACILTSFASSSNSNTVVDHIRIGYRLPILHTISTITSTKISFIHHLLFNFRGILGAMILALRSAYSEQTSGTCSGPPGISFTFIFCTEVPLLLLVFHACTSVFCKCYSFGAR